MKTRLSEMTEQAKKYHSNHVKVWDKFCEFSFDRICKGYSNYSTKAIFERIRWDLSGIGADGITEFKIGNNHPAIYARWFMEKYPEHQGFFRTRVQKSAVMPATGMEAKPSMVV